MDFDHQSFGAHRKFVWPLVALPTLQMSRCSAHNIDVPSAPRVVMGLTLPNEVHGYSVKIYITSVWYAVGRFTATIGWQLSPLGTAYSPSHYCTRCVHMHKYTCMGMNIHMYLCMRVVLGKPRTALPNVCTRLAENPQLFSFSLDTCSLTLSLLDIVQGSVIY